jgi:leucyl aminopeptidase
MKIQLDYSSLPSIKSDLLTVFAVDSGTGKGRDAKAQPELLTSSGKISRAAQAAIAAGEFKAGAQETLLFHAPKGLTAKRLLLVGLGKAAGADIHELRKAAGTAVRFAKPRGIRQVTLSLPEGWTESGAAKLPPGPCVQALTEGALIGDYDSDTYRSDRKDQSVRSVTVAVQKMDKRAAEESMRVGRILAESQNWARELVNEPSNKLTPTMLGERAAAMAKQFGLHCSVYSTAKLKELEMGAFLGVAQGSDEPPALIVMTYEPKQAAAKKAPVLGLVGKGITFDTGGISLKPADGMEKMKYDMAGAAAMLGAMRSLAQLKPANKVICIVCAAENMPSGHAQKPGDVQTAMSGKTIEVMNTDAEGRMVLADGLVYARRLGATHLIDAATLTGACVVALGMINAGMFTNNPEALGNFKRGLEQTGEKFWELPCTDDYREHIRSSIADIMNTGDSRWGGAITAAMFLKEFVDDTPWIHLDIAGVAWVEAVKPWIAKGPSGVAVRSIAEWVRGFDAPAV